MSSAVINATATADARRSKDQLDLAADYASGAEGIWIDEEDRREQATYERDTNAWVDDPYDQVSADDIVDDAQALWRSVEALGETSNDPGADPADLEALHDLRTQALGLARDLIETQGRPRSADGHQRSAAEIAEDLHRWWVELEEAWQVRCELDSASS